MKRVIILFAAISLYHIAAFGQKKYEIVIEKTDGSEVVINTEDIVKTYFREITNNSNDSDQDNTYREKIIGLWDYTSLHIKFLDNNEIRDINYTDAELCEFRTDGTLQYYDYEDDGRVVEDSDGYTWTINKGVLNVYFRDKLEKSYTIVELTDSRLVYSETREVYDGSNDYDGKERMAYVETIWVRK